MHVLVSYLTSLAELSSLLVLGAGMVLNEEKRARLAKVLALREEAATDASVPALSIPNVVLVTPSPAPSAPMTLFL